MEIAQLAMKIRGFGHVKSENLAAVNERRDKLMKQFRGELIPVVSEINEAA